MSNLYIETIKGCGLALTNKGIVPVSKYSKSECILDEDEHCFSVNVHSYSPRKLIGKFDCFTYGLPNRYTDRAFANIASHPECCMAGINSATPIVIVKSFAVTSDECFADDVDTMIKHLRDIILYAAKDYCNTERAYVYIPISHPVEVKPFENCETLKRSFFPEYHRQLIDKEKWVVILYK